MKNIIKYMFLAGMAAMLFSCQYKEIGDADFPGQKIYLGTASYGIYDVNKLATSEQQARRFILDIENEKFLVPMSVQRSGMDHKGDVMVNIGVDNDTIPKMIAAELLNYADENGDPREVKMLPSSSYTMPASVTVPDGSSLAAFNMEVDFTFMREHVDELFAIAVTIESPDREISAGLGVGIVVVDTKFMEMTLSFTYAQDSDDESRVIFTNTSDGAVSCIWDFGDGTTSTETSPVHTYATKGRKSVTLTGVGILGQEEPFTDFVDLWEDKGVTSFFPNNGRPTVNTGVLVNGWSSPQGWNLNDNALYISNEDGTVRVGGWGAGDGGLIQMEPVGWPSGAKATNAHIWCTKPLSKGKYLFNFNVGSSGIEPNGNRNIGPCFLDYNIIAAKGVTMPDIDDIDGNPDVLGGLSYRITAEETDYANWFVQDQPGGWTKEFYFEVPEDTDVSIGIVASFGNASFFRLFSLNQFKYLAY